MPANGRPVQEADREALPDPTHRARGPPALGLHQPQAAARSGEGLRDAILSGGVAQWNFANETITKERTFANLCDQELEVNKTGPTRWNTLEVVERTERRFESRITRCLYHELS